MKVTDAVRRITSWRLLPPHDSEFYGRLEDISRTLVTGRATERPNCLTTFTHLQFRVIQ